MSAKRRQSMHVNSLAAFYEGKSEFFSQREQQILRAYTQLGRASDRDVCNLLGFRDLNAVRPRITELIEDGVLEESGGQQCPVTGKLVRVVRIKPAKVTDQLDLFEPAREARSA